ncbi:TIGR00730 family Rossman fold protein [Granulicella sp. L60]|uniref:LOG family protein n=1 Tax=Granulicella sp. L60 TaxID=1641866 RepID=UPI00131B612D|nr:TIGR00730 family Rossman fold protein [Granulicella sp. L60]
MIRNIAVFCSSANGFSPVYRSAAEQLGCALADRNIGLIYGGANVGLMQAVADASLAANGRVVGVIPEVLVDLEVAHHGVTELHITSTMHTRKALIGEKADAFIVLPGGFGTFEELFEVLAWHTLKLHTKPILLLNINGFYDKLFAFLDHCVAEGMLKQKNRELILVADTVEEAFVKLNFHPAIHNSHSKELS